MAADPPDPGLLLTRGHTRSPQGDWRDAEVEAATDALLADSGLPRYGGHRATVERRMRIAFAAAFDCKCSGWSPQGEDRELPIAPSTSKGLEQGEDHEAGKLTQAATIICALIDQLQPGAPYDQGEALTAANLWLRLAGFTEETTPDA